MSPASPSDDRPSLRQLLREEHGLAGGALKRAMDAGRVRLCGVPTSDGGRRVDPEQITLVGERSPRLRPGRDLVLLYTDPEVAVIWKPAGLLSVPAPSHPEGHRSAEGLLRRLLPGNIHTVHRIDFETSGVLVFARTAAALEGLKGQLEARTMSRHYLTMVAGNPGDSRRDITAPLVRDRGDGRRGAVPALEAPPDALPATTHIEPLARLGPRVRLVRAQLETGRTHQLRLHLSHIGCPILGDPLYAPGGVTRAAPRLALHAATLGFDHPRTGARIQHDTLLPDDLEQLRRSLLAEQDNRRERGSRGRSKPAGRGQKKRGRGSKSRGRK